jgi:hypothetical protein
MGGFTSPTQIEVDPLAQSLRPLRDTSAGLLLQQLMGGQRPLQSRFSGLANPVEQLYPGATLNPPGTTQRPDDPRDIQRRNAGGFSCPDGYELNFLPDGTPVCTPASPDVVDNPRQPREPIPGYQPPPPPSEGGPAINTDDRNRPGRAPLPSASAFQPTPIPTAPSGTTTLQNALANPATFAQAGSGDQMDIRNFLSMLENLLGTPISSGSRTLNSYTPQYVNQTTSPESGNELFKLPR